MCGGCKIPTMNPWNYQSFGKGSSRGVLSSDGTPKDPKYKSTKKPSTPIPVDGASGPSPKPE